MKELIDETIKILNEFENNEFEAFVDKWAFNINNHLKYENGKLYYQSISGWHPETNIKIMRNIDKYKIGARHIDCNLPYSNYYIIDTHSGEIYEKSDVAFYGGWNGVLKEIITDLQAVINNEFVANQNKQPTNMDWDPMAW